MIQESGLPFEYAIQTLALTKRYGKTVACDSVSLVVRPGEIFGFLGPNGAGKSTFVKMILGLVHPTEGLVRLFGRPHTELAPRRRVGYVPELFRYQEWLTAEEVVRLHARLAKRTEVDRTEILRVLAIVGLESRARHRVRAFSKGMQQRLGLAAALVGEPDLLVLDEPTSAMDPVGRREVTDLLRRLRAEGKTVFLNSHLLSDLQGLCDRVALIGKGRIHYVGDMADILGAKPRYRIVVGAMNAEAVAALSELEGLTVADASRQSGVLHLDGDRERLPVIHRALAKYGVDVYEVESVLQSLEDWFIDTLRESGEPDVDHR